MPPAHTIFSTDGDLVRFTLASYERGNPQRCEDVRKCSRYVDAPTLRRTRDADGIVHVVGVERPDRNPVFRADFDEIYFAQIVNAVDGARLEETPRCLSFHNTGTTLVVRI